MSENKIFSGVPEFYEMVKNAYTPHTKELYETYSVKRGLRNQDGTGVMAGLTSIGDVHGYVIEDGERQPREGRLRYRGIDVRDIVAGCQKESRFGFEEVAFLLLSGVLPTKEQLDSFNAFLGAHRTLPDSFVEDMIMKAPSANIMNKLARCVLASYSYDANPDDTSFPNIFRQSIELIARFPTMAAYGYQAKVHYHGGKSMYIHPPKRKLSTAENFLYMMRADNQFTALEAQILDLALVLHAEHGGGNNSAFATRVLSSSGTDTYSAIAAAIGSLKGPKHGGANAKVMGMIQDFKDNIADITNPNQVAAHIVKILKKEAYDCQGLVYGMGHAIYTLSDPRAVLLKQKARQLAEEKNMLEEYTLYELIEELTPGLFAQIKNDSKVICANVDLYSGFVYQMLDIPPELYTPLFAISRIVGWCAHRLEEVMTSGRIIRPAYKAVLPTRHYVALEDRKDE